MYGGIIYTELKPRHEQRASWNAEIWKSHAMDIRNKRSPRISTMAYSIQNSFKNIPVHCCNIAIPPTWRR